MQFNLEDLVRIKRGKASDIPEESIGKIGKIKKILPHSSPIYVVRFELLIEDSYEVDFYLDELEKLGSSFYSIYII